MESLPYRVNKAHSSVCRQSFPLYGQLGIGSLFVSSQMLILQSIHTGPDKQWTPRRVWFQKRYYNDDDNNYQPSFSLH